MYFIPNQADTDRFHTKYEKGFPDSCWYWKGVPGSNGYGAFKIKGTPYNAHRVAYTIAFGAFDWLLEVCHKCDNKLCVNPNHLFLGTHKDNMNDRTQKLRHAFCERHGNCILSEEEVIELIKLHSEGMSARKLARKFKISHVQAWRIATRQRWQLLGVT